MTLAVEDLGKKKACSYVLVPHSLGGSLCVTDRLQGKVLRGNGFLSELQTQKLSCFFKGGYQIWIVLCINQLNLDL